MAGLIALKDRVEFIKNSEWWITEKQSESTLVNVSWDNGEYATGIRYSFFRKFIFALSRHYSVGVIEVDVGDSFELWVTIHVTESHIKFQTTEAFLGKVHTTYTLAPFKG